MINGNLENFLDTGWITEATLYYNGFAYWFEGYYKPEIEKWTYFVNRWRAKLSDDMCTSRYILNDDIVDFEKVFELKNTDVKMEKAREIVLNAPIFDGKCFWEVESELIWVDESCDGITISDISEI